MLDLSNTIPILGTCDGNFYQYVFLSFGLTMASRALPIALTKSYHSNTLRASKANLFDFDGSGLSR